MKFKRVKGTEKEVKVAPRAGAWIEILYNGETESFSMVAPRAGAWIEITPGIADYNTLLGRSPCGSVD